MRADELRLEAGDEHAAAERENLLFCRAAVKLLAVDKAGVVQNHVVSHFGSALGDGNHARRLLAEPVHLAVQLSSVTVSFSKFAFKPLYTKLMMFPLRSYF